MDNNELIQPASFLNIFGNTSQFLNLSLSFVFNAYNILTLLQ